MSASISTHVLDTRRGAPARGLRVELFRNNVRLSARVTDADGRIADLALAPLRAGTYRLVFRPGRRSGFFSRIEVEFVVADPRRHYHIPLLLAPYACMTYRGS
ncbi:MAG TPA: hydroxyisourate hydrolase [bacterium]|nr:hydroxyisourate hydrolase [bacterium]